MSAWDRDVEVSADVGYWHAAAHAASGLSFRYTQDARGYAVGLREIEKGVHPEFGPGERPVLQLFRLERGGWKLLQESKVRDCRSGPLRRLKVICRGPNTWVILCVGHAGLYCQSASSRTGRPTT